MRPPLLDFGRMTREEAEFRAAEARALLARLNAGELELPSGMNPAT